MAWSVSNFGTYADLKSKSKPWAQAITNKVDYDFNYTSAVIEESTLLKMFSHVHILFPRSENVRQK